MTNATDVKQGDRVLFLVGGVTLPGIARTAARAGVHPGTKLGGVFVTLTYLNPSGQPVQVLNAPLLPASATDDDVKSVVAATVVAARQKGLVRPDPAQTEPYGLKAGVPLSAEPDEAELAAEYRAVKAETGWRPLIDGEDVAQLKAYAAGLERELNDAHCLQAAASQTIATLTHQNEQLTAHAAATVGSTDAEKTAQDSQHAAEVAGLKATIATLQEEVTAKDQDNEELKKQLAFAVQLFPGDPAAENGAQGADPGAQAQGGQAQQNS